MLENFTQADLIAPGVGQLDADGIAAGNDRDAGAGGAHGAGDIVGERHDARGFGAACGFELEERHDRAWLDVAHFAFDAEVGEHILEQPCGAAQNSLRQLT